MITRSIPIGLAYAANQINATIFRVHALASHGAHQYVIYYAPDGTLTVGQRAHTSSDWHTTSLALRPNLRDAHNVAVLGVSADGYIHIAYDHHNNPLHYRVSERPHDISAFGLERPMTGQRERQVTYPQFVNAPDATLYFFFRDGRSGDGSLCLNRYDADRRAWHVLQRPLIDGLGRCNPYWWRPSFGPDGTLHLAWCWRDTPDARTNHDMCYARSLDGGHTWQRSDGTPQPLPITPYNAEVIDPIPAGSNLINQCSSIVDSRGRPHLAHYHNDEQGLPQYYHLWHDGQRWMRQQVSQRRQGFRLGGGGTLRIPISRPEVAVTADDQIDLITRDAEYGNGIRLYRSAGDYAQWEAIDLLEHDLGSWEPAYDQERLRASGILSLFVLPVQQGDHEAVTDFQPQEARVLETYLG